MERTYQHCPPSLALIARYHFIVVVCYLLFDLIPVARGGSGSGYSLLFSTFPLSFLILYTDQPAQQLGHRLVTWLLCGFIALLGIKFGLHLTVGQTVQGSTVWDIAGIALLGAGLLGGLAIMGLHQWWRRRIVPLAPLQLVIDDLFTQHTQAAFWQHLTTHVGGRLGVTGWLWARRSPTGQWDVLEQTTAARREWLDDPAMQSLLAHLPPDRPQSVVVDRTNLPSTVLVLPIVRTHHLAEVLLLANPTNLAASVRVEQQEAIVTRLMQAVLVLRRREADGQLALQQAAIATQMHALADTRRQISAAQRRKTFQANRRFSVLLHDETLPQLAALLHRIQTTLPAAQATALEDQCQQIARNLRRLAHDLRPAGVKQLLRYSLDHALMEWESQYPHIRFVYTFTADEQGLDDYERDTLYLILTQVVENALRHASATQITLTGTTYANQIIFTVRDDGCGFHHDPDLIPPDALGLRQRYDMAAELGGTLTIATSPGAGCTVTVTLPQRILPEPSLESSGEDD
ncbi:MAG: hypothetical protein HC911_17970 [Chloroflexaceae bacterium]|nr:hypothetical protein [Chloroflexaceae bacterium]